MKLRIISTLVILLTLSGLSFQSFAGPPDFSDCDGLQGAARGLCHAGVAVGCNVDGSSNACMRIAERFEEVTGEPPPYALVSLSATSGIIGICFDIIDLGERLTLADMVIFHAPGDDPINGYPATIVAVVSDPPNFLRISVPVVPIGLYQVSVLENDQSPKFGPFNFEVIHSDTRPPPCDDF